MSNAWTNGLNWSGNIAPGPGDDLQFPYDATKSNSNDNYTNGTAFNSIQFWHGGNSTPNRIFDLTGNSIVLNAGVSAVNSFASLWPNSVSNLFILNSSQTFSTGPFTSLTFKGPINLNGKDLTFDTAASAPIDVHAVISGAGGLIKTNPGTLTLWSNNTYSGSTVLSGGTLQIYGSQSANPIELVAGTFSGRGTVGAVIANGSGSPDTVIFQPGLTGSPMTSSNLTLNSASTFQVDLISGGIHNWVTVHGTVALNNATLAVTLGYTPAVGDTFLIISNDGNDPVSGTFNGLPEGTVFTVGGLYFRITYTGLDGNDVMFSRVSKVLTVTNNADSGPGSLRDTLSAANDTDTIDFAPNVTGSIKLTSGKLVVDKSVNIIGPGSAVLAVNGNFPVNRIFYITNGVTALISGLALTNGNGGSAGGAVYNAHSTVTVSNCVISGNPEQGIFNNGEYSNAVMTLTSCTLTRNTTSANGGAVLNDGFAGSAILTVTNCTFSSNTASEGSAIMNSCDAGGSATLKVYASTFVANSGSAILNVGGGAGNPVLEVGNTLFQSISPSVGIINSMGTVISDGYNLTSDNGGGFLTNATDQLNTDAKIGPLTDNGGPTPTHNLLWGSPAIDKGKAFGISTDQRGVARPHDLSSITNASGGDGSDIGAVEFVPPSAQLSSVTTLGNAVQIQGAGFSNLSYTIQGATNLNSVIPWTNIGSATANSNGIFSFTDTNAALLPLRFYRAISP